MNIKSKTFGLSALVLLLLVTSFLTIWLPSLPMANADNPNITFTGNQAVACNSTITCASPLDLFGVITSPNPHTIPNRGLITVVQCSATGYESTYALTDTIGDTWVLAGKLFLKGGLPIEIFTTNVVATASITFHISLTYTNGGFSNPFYCEAQLFLVIQEAIVPSKLNFGAFTSFNSNHNGLTTKHNNLGVTLTSGVIPVPANALSFTVVYWNQQNGDPITETNSPNMGLKGQQAIGAGVFEAINDYGNYIPTPQNIQYNVALSSSNSPTDYTYVLNLFTIILVPLTQSPSSCVGTTCGITGGGSIASNTQFSLSANNTYYYEGQSGISGVKIQNISTVIAGYVNAGAGKSNDTIDLSIYQSTCQAAGLPVVTVTCPLNRVYIQPFTIHTGIGRQWLHPIGLINITIPANSTYAVSYISKYSGVTLYEAINTQPMFSTPEGTFQNTNWQPPQMITIDTPASPQMFLEWFGIINPSVTTSTSTTTTIVTCSSGQQCVSGTVTTTNTVTSNSYSHNSKEAPVNTVQDLIIYFPFYIFPILLSPLGVQGVLVGFLIGAGLGGVLGIIPLYASFLLSLGILYLLYKRT